MNFYGVLMNISKHVKKNKIYVMAASLDMAAFLVMKLATVSSDFANFYSQNIYHFLSLVISQITGIVPVSIVEILLYITLLFIIADLFMQLKNTYIGCVSTLRGSVRKSQPENKEKKYAAVIAKNLLQRISVFILHLFLILSLIYILYVFNCGINYRRSSFSTEAALTSIEEDLNQETLISLCDYLVENINTTTQSLISASYSDKAVADTYLMNAGALGTASVAPLKLYNGAYIGQDGSSDHASAKYLWITGKAGQKAMSAIGAKYERLSGPYPYPKPVLNSWILSVQQTTGVYSPFTIEANYNRDIPYYDIPFTICHELSHLKGYMQEEEANFIAVLSTIGSDDLYFNYSGYVSAWVYAGNALYNIDPDKFAELYQKINAYTLRDLRYNNEYWDQYESKIAETHEEINDAYLRSNGQTSGVQSYGHVTDLMLTYFTEHGNLNY